MSAFNSQEDILQKIEPYFLPIVREIYEASTDVFKIQNTYYQFPMSGKNLGNQIRELTIQRLVKFAETQKDIEFRNLKQDICLLLISDNIALRIKKLDRNSLKPKFNNTLASNHYQEQLFFMKPIMQLVLGYTVDWSQTQLAGIYIQHPKDGWTTRINTRDIEDKLFGSKISSVEPNFVQPKRLSAVARLKPHIKEEKRDVQQ